MSVMKKENEKTGRYLVRDFRKEDAEALSSLIREDILIVNTEDAAWEREWLFNFYTPENIIKSAQEGHTYVIEDTVTGEHVATGNILRDCPAREGAVNETEIRACFIRAGFLHQGLGTLLFDALETDPAFQEASRVWLTTSVYAAPFYEQRGYRYVFGYRGKNQDNLTEMEKFPQL